MLQNENVKNKTPFFIALLFIIGFGGGLLGAGISFRYFIHPEDYCFCKYSANNTNINSAIQIPEIIRLKKFLGIKEDIQARAIYESVRPVIVSIYKRKEVSKNLLEGIYTLNEYLGGGFILTSDGWIISSINAPGNPKKEDVVVVYNSNIYRPEFIVFDSYSGSTFIKISENNMPVARIGSIEDIEIGQSVLALSAVGGIVSTSISEQNQRFPQQDVNSFIESTEKFSDYISIKDELGRKYNSGVIANLDGEIIGIIIQQKNETKLQSVLGIDYLQPAIRSILRDKKILRPYFGVKYIDLSRAFGLNIGMNGKTTKGMLIWESPQATSPAGIAGLKNRDIILRIDNIEITGSRSIGSIVQEYSFGDTINVLLLRNGKELKINVNLGLM